MVRPFSWRQENGFFLTFLLEMRIKELDWECPVGG